MQRQRFSINFILLTLLVTLGSILLNCQSQKYKLRLFYSSDMYGYIEPCG